MSFEAIEPPSFLDLDVGNAFVYLEVPGYYF
jgi:hypothetical protein